MRKGAFAHRVETPLAATVLSIVIPAVLWGLLARSAWVAVATLVLCGLPPAWFRARRPPFLPWLGYGLLAGGTMTAAALLTGHARLP